MVVGEGDTQLASLRGHSGLKVEGGGGDRKRVEWMLSLVRPSPLAWLLPFYLELLPSDGLHFSLLADGELVGDCGTFGVDVGPAEGVAVLGDLGDHLVVAALCDDVIGDACGGGGEARAVTSFFFCPSL